MKRTLVLLGLALVAAIAVDMLGDATQDRPDRVKPGSRSEIVLAVEDRSRHRSPLHAAESLWGACRGGVYQTLVEPGPVETTPGRVQMVTEPALGEHAWRRLQGCLEDATVDRVSARVVSKRDTLAKPGRERERADL